MRELSQTSLDYKDPRNEDICKFSVNKKGFYLTVPSPLVSDYSFRVRPSPVSWSLFSFLSSPTPVPFKENE